MRADGVMFHGGLLIVLRLGCFDKVSANCDMNHEHTPSSIDDRL
jgi:hypothetical protein